ncbi:MAG: SGNH/GDSL hydrolase family protein [Gammaproteobacteria bacterium]|nr:SGNH/GDSL hydrolase family protein [Gammaproteobacteria bacterium]
MYTSDNKKKNCEDLSLREQMAKALSTATLLSLLLLTSLSGGVLQHAHAQSDASALNWVTTWSASPSSLPPGMLPPETIADAFSDQTLRLILHTSIGGDMVRVRVSNTHGNKRLHIGAATIALQSEGSGIVPGSLTRLTFGGEESITISRGGLVFSDPVPFNVPQLSNLSVSLYLPEPSGTVTTHLAAAQTNYVASGNATANTELSGAEEIVVWNYLTAVDVGRRDDITAIVTLGDSITDGVGSNRDLNNRWPNYLARRLLTDDNAPDFAVVNAGISGNRVLQENSARFGENLQVRFERDVLALSGVSHIVLLEGINDIGMGNMFPGEHVAPEEIIAGYRQIITRAHAKGLKIIGATLTPFEGAGYYTEEGEQKRQAVNAWIRTSGEFDGVIDFEIPARDPSHITRLVPSYTSDNLHPNDEGYKAMADAIDLDLFR